LIPALKSGVGISLVPKGTFLVPMTTYVDICLALALAISICLSFVVAKQEFINETEIILDSNENSLKGAPYDLTNKKSAHFLLAFRWPWERSSSSDNIEYEWDNEIYAGSFTNECSTFFLRMVDILPDSDGADVISFSPISKTVSREPNFANVWIILLSKMGLQNTTSSNFHFFASKCWIAKPIWIKKYLAFHLKAIQIIQSNSDIMRLLYTVSTYDGHLAYRPTYYKYIQERLPSFFFWIHSLKVHRVHLSSPVVRLGWVENGS
jgi:hypothetical protein